MLALDADVDMRSFIDSACASAGDVAAVAATAAAAAYASAAAAAATHAAANVFDNADAANGDAANGDAADAVATRSAATFWKLCYCIWWTNNQQGQISNQKLARANQPPNIQQGP